MTPSSTNLSIIHPTQNWFGWVPQKKLNVKTKPNTLICCILDVGWEYVRTMKIASKKKGGGWKNKSLRLNVFIWKPDLSRILHKKSCIGNKSWQNVLKTKKSVFNSLNENGYVINVISQVHGNFLGGRCSSFKDLHPPLKNSPHSYNCV